jgi:hypothetical protein
MSHPYTSPVYFDVALGNSRKSQLGEPLISWALCISVPLQMIVDQKWRPCLKRRYFMALTACGGQYQ